MDTIQTSLYVSMLNIDLHSFLLIALEDDHSGEWDQCQVGEFNSTPISTMTDQLPKGIFVAYLKKLNVIVILWHGLEQPINRSNT